MSKRFISVVHRPSAISHPSRERGVALILTLAILALVTLLLIAFVTSMRVENMASRNFNNVIAARELAKGAIDQAAAQIRSGTPLRTKNGNLFTTYVTFPGAIYTNFYNGIVNNFGSISLSSPINSSLPALISQTNLNDHFWITGSNNVEYANPVASAMNVGWVYIAQDPTTTAGPNNPLTGRFAYWVDDEASKVNLNTAGATAATGSDPLGVYSGPNYVDLSQLLPRLGGLASMITARQAPSGNGYTTIEEVKLVDTPPNVYSDFNTNRFYLTTYSDDQGDLDAFDRPRLDVSQLTKAKDITDTTGPYSAYARLSDLSLTASYGPTITKGFDLKYGVNGLKQIIANIVAYQMDPTSATFTPPDAGNSPPDYLGLGRTPYITEVQIEYDVTPANPPSQPSAQVKRTISVQMLYIYGGTYTPVGTETITVSVLPDASPSLGFLSSVPLNVSGVFNSGIPRVFSSTPETVNLPGSVNLPASATTTRLVYQRGSTRLDYSQMNLQQVSLSPANASTVYQSAVTDDPAVNDVDADWTKSTTSLLLNSTAYPGAHDPSKVVIRGGLMQSTGELGYIHTPTAWQHLTLQQGGGSSSGQIPDWAVLDIFTIPNAKTRGRININGLLTAASPLPTATRLIPLNALLSGLSLATAAQGIYQDINRTLPDSYGMQMTGGNGVFDTIGEVCEVIPLTGGAPTEAGKEAAIRRIANTITTRSNAFTVWVVAQSIKQVNGPARTQPIGTFDSTMDVITSEVRARAVVERYETSPGNAGNQVKYRTRYFRYLYN